MRKFVTSVALAAGIMGLGLQGASAEIKLGVAAEPYPPFAEKTAAGNWEGWEIEIGDALCKAMEEECTWVEVSWDGIIPALLAKKIDAIISSMSITAERMKTIDFSDKYYNTPTVMIADKSSGIDGSPESLKGKIIGVQVSTVHENFATQYFGDVADIKTYQTFDEHNQDLAAGRIDAVIADSLALTPFMESDPGACCEVKTELFDIDIFGPGVGVGLRKEDTALKDKFNAAIEKIREDGTFDAISEGYFNFDIYGG